MPKISELTAISNVSTDDLMLVVNDPGGAPSSNKITVQGFATAVTGMLRYANSTVTGTVRTGEYLTANSTGYLTLSFNNLPGPYANDAVANTAGVSQFGIYYDSSGNVKIRLT